MNICNTEKLIIPGLCQFIPGFVVKPLHYPGIPRWLVIMGTCGRDTFHASDTEVCPGI